MFRPAQRLPDTTRYGLVVGYALLVLVVSVMPVADTGAAPLGPFGVIPVDKWVHLGTYTILAVLLAFALRAGTFRLLVLIGVAAILYGFGIELLQLSLTSRQFEILDILANTVGAVVGCLGWWWRTHRRRDRERAG